MTIRSTLSSKLRAATSGLLLAGMAAQAQAGQQAGQVEQLLTRGRDGLVYFYLSGTATGKPACAVNRYWMIKDENSSAGKRQLAVLLAARASGQQVIVVGSNTCTRWPDGEDVDELRY